MNLSTDAMDNMNNYENMVVNASEHYEQALSTLKDLGSAQSTGIAGLTVGTLQVQEASSKLELQNNAIKSATNMANSRARF